MDAFAGRLQPANVISLARVNIQFFSTEEFNFRSCNDTARLLTNAEVRRFAIEPVTMARITLLLMTSSPTSAHSIPQVWIRIALRAESQLLIANQPSRAGAVPSPILDYA